MSPVCTVHGLTRACCRPSVNVTARRDEGSYLRLHRAATHSAAEAQSR